jgi:hypothetical protein
MAQKVTDIEIYRRQKTENHLADVWQRQFGETYRVKDGLAGIANTVLRFLAEPSDRSDQAYGALIWAVLEPDDPKAFSCQSRQQQSRILDIQFYLTDRIRFEMMRRLGWLCGYVGDTKTIPAIILGFDALQYQDFEDPPKLSPDHQGYADYQRLIPREKGVFVRRLYPEALSVFQQQQD